MKEALPKSQFRSFLRNVVSQPQLRNAAIAIFSEVRNFKPDLESFTSAIFDNFLAMVFGRFMKKKSEVKNLVNCPFRL
jgi:hypothetical protein